MHLIFSILDYIIICYLRFNDFSEMVYTFTTVYNAVFSRYIIFNINLKFAYHIMQSKRVWAFDLRGISSMEVLSCTIIYHINILKGYENQIIQF